MNDLVNSDIGLALWLLLPFALLLFGIGLSGYSLFKAGKNNQKVNLKILISGVIIVIFALIRLNTPLVKGIAPQSQSPQNGMNK